MTADALRYDQWIADALSGVVKRAVALAASEGLPGDHHFYITFRTGAPGVHMPSHLKARYPEDMTIVLQHQYSDLMVDDAAFSVTLKFQGRSSRLVVPFAAMTAFADPSVNFGLQLKPAVQAAVKTVGETAGTIAKPAPAPAVKTAPQPPADDAAAEDKKKGEVIALDAFRKKS